MCEIVTETANSLIISQFQTFTLMNWKNRESYFSEIIKSQKLDIY